MWDTMRILRKTVLLLLALGLTPGVSPALRAQDSGSAPAGSTDVSQRLEELQKELKRLEAEIAELKKRQEEPPATPSTTSAGATTSSDPALLLKAIEDLRLRAAQLAKQIPPQEAGKESSQGEKSSSAPAPQEIASVAGNRNTDAPPPESPAPPPGPDPSVADWGPAVTGIYTMPTTKDLGAVTGQERLEGIKFRGWVSTYYGFNFNTPDRQVVNANQSSSVIRARNATVEGRTFDIHSNSFSLELAEIEIEKVPVAGSRLGFKFDLAFGETQDIIADSIGAGLGRESISDFDKIFQHASIGYLAPLGRGLRIDVGKFVTHIGGETIANIKNHNFSHGFFYTYAIPFQDTGVRFNYAWSDISYTEFYVLNGWNATFDNNKGKTFAISQGWTPSSKFSMVANWMGGPEQNDNSSNWRHLGDFQLFINPTPRLRTLTNIDLAWEKAPPSLNGKNARWHGVMEMIRYQVTPRFSPAFRLEWYRDPDGFTTGVPQNLYALTVTLDYKLGNGRFDRVLVRPEWRYDHSTANFFSRNGQFRATDHQQTVAVAFVYYF